MARPSSLSGKVVLVTGASRGIGAATAKALVGRGAKVALVGLEPERLAGLAAELGDAAAWYEADVADAGAVERAVGAAVARFGGIDVVLSNAGVGVFALLANLASDEMARVLTVNLVGTWNVIRATLPQLVERRGYFLANASLAAALACPGMGAYSVSKAAIESLCDTLRQEVTHKGVSVGVAYFCWIDTELVSATDKVHPGFAFMRTQLPGIVRAVSPIGVAVEALVRGMERRAPRVFAPGKLRLLLALRWVLALKLARDAARFMPDLEKMH